MAKKPRRYKGRSTQGDKPEWGPLLDVVGEAVTCDFMWMFEVELSDGRLLQAYKHIDTRGYLHLDRNGAAFVYEDPDRYRRVPVLELLRAVLPCRCQTTLGGSCYAL